MRQLNTNKKAIIKNIMDNQDILKLLHYEDNSVDIFGLDDLTTSEKLNIRKNKIFEYRKIPTSDKHDMNTYIAIEYGVVEYGSVRNKNNNPCFNTPEIIFYIITHSSLDNNLIIGSRIDEIESILVETFHRKFKLENVGICSATVSNRINLPNDFVGRELHMQFVDSTQGV